MIWSAVPIRHRLSWMIKGNPNLLGARIYNNDVGLAAWKLEKHAALKGMKIAEVARFTNKGVDVAFARGVA
jgi:hypothetical protein